LGAFQLKRRVNGLGCGVAAKSTPRPEGAWSNSGTEADAMVEAQREVLDLDALGSSNVLWERRFFGIHH